MRGRRAQVRSGTEEDKGRGMRGDKRGAKREEKKKNGQEEGKRNRAKT